MQMLTPREVAARLRVSLATARRLINAGVIPGVTLIEGRQRRLVRVLEDALEHALREPTHVLGPHVTTHQARR